MMKVNLMSELVLEKVRDTHEAMTAEEKVAFEKQQKNIKKEMLKREAMQIKEVGDDNKVESKFADVSIMARLRPDTPGKKYKI